MADVIRVQSDRLPDGTYVAAIHYDADRSRVITEADALRYVLTVHEAAARAEHDAAVVAQLTSLGLDMPTVGQALAELRDARRPLDDAATAPLRLVPGVSADRGVGFLDIHIDDRHVGQWDPSDARDHAGDVLAVLAVVDLDTAYRRYLSETISLDQAQAENVVAALAKHMVV
jgi:hypothetical protein